MMEITREMYDRLAHELGNTTVVAQTILERVDAICAAKCVECKTYRDQLRDRIVALNEVKTALREIWTALENDTPRKTE